MTSTGSEHQAVSISILYTGEQLALCSSRNTPCERFPCVHCLDHSCPGDEHGRPSFCRLSLVHPVHIAIYCTKLPQLMCHVQISVNIVTFIKV
jgi:hypothetical protein